MNKINTKNALKKKTQDEPLARWMNQKKEKKKRGREKRNKLILD